MHDYLLRLYFEQCLSTAAWAGGAALAVHLLASLGATAPGRAAAVALVLGLFTALFTVDGVPPLPPASRWQWVPWLTAASLLLLLVEEGKSAEGARVPLLLAPHGRGRVVHPAPERIGSRVRRAGAARLPDRARRSSSRCSGSGDAAREGADVADLRPPAVATAGERRRPTRRTSQDFGRIMAGFAAALGAIGAGGLAKATEMTGRTAVTVSTVAACGILLVNGLASDFPIASTLLLLAAWLAPLLPNQGTFKDHALQFSAAFAPAALAAFIASW
jgi:hypothetical protein